MAKSPAELLAESKRKARPARSEETISPLWENRIKELRTKLNLTYREVATAIGVSESVMIYLENGKHDPGLTLAVRVAKFFGLAVEQVWVKQLREKGKRGLKKGKAGRPMAEVLE